MKTKTLLATALVALFAASAYAQPAIKNGVLADGSGRTVYTFDKDEMNKSNCTGNCLALWPAYMSKPTDVAVGDYGLLGESGARQWTLKGKPLYFYVEDTTPGDRKGDGKLGIWHVVKV